MALKLINNDWHSEAWQRSIKFVLDHEGGFTVDSGGPTRFGISQRAHPDVDVRNLTEESARVIYYKEYWNRMRCYEMPWPLCLVVMDAGVNCGRHRAGCWLQEALNDVYGFGLKVDGIIGKRTVNTLPMIKTSTITVSLKVINHRLTHYLALRRRFPQYLAGWVSRVNDVIEAMT